MSKRKNVIYAILLGLGISLSILIIVLAYFFNNPIINYFLGFSASIIVSVLFSLILDVMSARDIKKKIYEEKKNYLLEIKSKLSELMFKLTKIGTAFNKGFEKIDELLNAFFDDYCKEINNLYYNTVNENTYFLLSSTRLYINDQCLDSIKSVLNRIINNKQSLISNGVFSNYEIYVFEQFLIIICRIVFPYSDSFSLNLDTYERVIVRPNKPVSDSVINNFKNNSISLKKMILEDLSKMDGFA